MEKVIEVNKIKNPSISIIIPTLNEEKYLEKTLVSVKMQTFKKPYEIIVADSNSKDRTVEIAKKHADKIVITNKKGVSVGRNLGAKYSKGKILFFLDADTILLPDVLSNVYKVMKKRDVVGCNVALILDKIQMNSYFALHIPIYNFLNKFNSIPVYTVAFACKKNVFETIGGFNEKLKVGEDIDLGRRIKKFGKVSYLSGTFAVTSARRLKKQGHIESFLTWFLSYPYFRTLKKQPKYPPVR